MSFFGSYASVYVMPTEEGLPHRALIIEPLRVPIAAVYNEEEELWEVDGHSLSDNFSEVITEHARSLGVEI